MMYGSTCHERTPSGSGKSVPTWQVAGRQRDGWVGAPNVIPLARLHHHRRCSYWMHRHNYVRYAVVIERRMNASYSSWCVLYSTWTHVFDVSQLLALHIFHIRPPEFHSANECSSVCFACCRISWQLDNKRSKVYTMRPVQSAQHLHSLVTKNCSLLRHRGLKTEDVTSTTWCRHLEFKNGYPEEYL